MQNNFKISTWNLCLGLPNKKDMITDSLKTFNISVCCMQETEVLNDFPEDQLNYNGYTLELEQSGHKNSFNSIQFKMYLMCKN